MTNFIYYSFSDIYPTNETIKLYEQIYSYEEGQQTNEHEKNDRKTGTKITYRKKTKFKIYYNEIQLFKNIYKLYYSRKYQIKSTDNYNSNSIYCSWNRINRGLIYFI